jgi:hypothetical protein
MDSDAPNHVIMRSLAHNIALGGHLVRWAKRNGVAVEVAREWNEIPEFREFVEKYRLEHAERMVGKVARCVERAIDRLVELSENTRNVNVALAATKAIIDQWVALSVYFVQEQKYWSLDKRVKELVAARKAEKKAAYGGFRR